VQLRVMGSRLSQPLLIVPLALLLVIVILGLLRVSGSSVALDSLPAGDDPLVLSARPVRSDEYATRTPLVIRQAELNYPDETEVGMGVHDTGVLSDLPVKTVSAIVKPHSWPYFVLGVERAFAIEWWLTALGPFFGVYAVVAVLTRSTLLSALAGLFASAAPATVWWLIPSSGLSILYAGLTCALLMIAVRASGGGRFVAAGFGGWTAAAFATLLYLPWLIPLTLVFGAIVVSQLPNLRKSWRRLLLLGGVFGGVFVVLIAVFLKDHRAALQAITNSVYPGDRRSSGGEALPGLLFDAPYDVFSAARNFTTVSGANQSEAASGLMLWLPIALAGGAFSGFRSGASFVARALAAVMTLSVVLAAWALLPVPSWLGAALGLTRVQGSRLALPLMVASAIAAALYIHRVRTEEGFRPSTVRLVVSAMAFGFITVRDGTTLRIGTDTIPLAWVVVIALLVAAITAAVLDGRILVGLGGCCALALFGSLRINPLQVGLDPVTDNALSRQIDEVRDADRSARWVALGLDYRMKSTLVATGAATVNGVSWYADKDTWKQFDPNEWDRDIWDRYGQITVALDDDLEAVQFELRTSDSIIVYSPSCDGLLQILAVRFVVNDEAFESPCLRLVDDPRAEGERWIYEVVDPAVTN
jgi:hypothetical protein